MSDQVFDKFKNAILDMDPCSWAEKYLTLDGKPYRLKDAGYRPIIEIMRFIGIKNIGKDSKPVIIVKSRQTGMTVTSCVLEMFFMCSGLFGNSSNPPIRVAHIFPFLDHAAAFSKTKLSAMIDNSILVDSPNDKKGKKPYLRTLIDNSSSTNDNLQFKQFKGGNHLWIESAGIEANRLRGKTCDVLLFDECLVYDTYIETIDGKKPIGRLVKNFLSGKNVPLVKTFNEETESFEYKEIINAWKREERELVLVRCGKRKVRCTPNHKFLTNNGWVQASELKIGTLIITSIAKNSGINDKNYGFETVNYVTALDKKEKVYDIEVKDNHNFIVTPGRKSKNVGGLCLHNCQDIPQAALANSTKVLTKAQYGSSGDGIQVYFGTPKQRGSDFWKMWQQSSQQFYHLGCEKCSEFFPLYTQGSNEWESIWIYANIVKCTHCGCEQDRMEAINRGKWIATRDPADAKFVGFHLNQLYLPEFTKEKIIDSKPGNSAINTERAYQNEVLGEFFQGEAAIITPEDIREKCGDPERRFRGTVTDEEEITTFLGIDIGAKADLEQLANSDRVKSQGQSYSTAVVLSLTGPGRLSIEYAFKFKRNDLESKKSIIDETIKRYKTKLAICDIGYAHDFNEIMQTEYGEKFLASAASGKVNDKIKYNGDIFPKVITFERDFWIMELYEQMKKGLIRFPLGSYEQIAWLIQHCSNMEIKPSLSRTGEVTPHYIKSGVNDGFMALLNAYIAYKFYISKGFTIKNTLLYNDFNTVKKQQSSVIAVYAPRQ